MHLFPEENQEEKHNQSCEIRKNSEERIGETQWNQSEENTMVREEVLKSYDSHSLYKLNKHSRYECREWEEKYWFSEYEEKLSISTNPIDSDEIENLLFLTEISEKEKEEKARENTKENDSTREKNLCDALEGFLFFLDGIAIELEYESRIARPNRLTLSGILHGYDNPIGLIDRISQSLHLISSSTIWNHHSKPWKIRIDCFDLHTQGGRYSAWERK